VSVPQRQIAIMAYGSLISEPGPRIRPLVVDRIARRTPFPVEFGRASRRWGDGPVLVPHPDGGPVEGALLVLHRSVGLGAAVELLRVREGMPDPSGVVQVEAAGPLLIIAANLPRNLPAPDMRPEALARRAALSVATGPRNGVAYLRGVTSSGIVTPRTPAYVEAVLAMADRAPSLEEAERRLVAFAGKSDEGSAVGLG
jgi:hypothetical protein